MKKVLAVLLSVMMLFGALTVGTSGAFDGDSYTDEVLTSQVILSFNLNAGSIKGGVHVYEGLDAEGNPVFSYNNNYMESMYYMIPSSDESQRPGDIVTLPNVSAPADHAFNGWYCYLTNETYAANRSFRIPTYINGGVIEFVADFSRTTPEEDTMGTVLDILVKVFGTIVGLLFLQGEADPVEAGMQMMGNLLDNLFE